MKPASSSLAKTGAIALVIAAAGIGSALAASGSSGSGAAPIVCKKGYVYSQKSHTCVQANSGLIDDKDLYEQGRALAKAGYYEQALAALHAVKKQDDSMVLTMIGYSNRKMGNVAEGMSLLSAGPCHRSEQHQHPRVSRRRLPHDQPHRPGPRRTRQDREDLRDGLRAVRDSLCLQSPAARPGKSRPARQARAGRVLRPRMGRVCRGGCLVADTTGPALRKNTCAARRIPPAARSLRSLR